MELDINCSLADSAEYTALMKTPYTIGDPINTDLMDRVQTNYTPYVDTWYPNYVQYWDSGNSLEKAFRLVQKLITKKFVKEPKTVKDFIELVNVLAEEL